MRFDRRTILAAVGGLAASFALGGAAVAEVARITHPAPVPDDRRVVPVTAEPDAGANGAGAERPRPPTRRFQPRMQRRARASSAHLLACAKRTRDLGR